MKFQKTKILFLLILFLGLFGLPPHQFAPIKDKTKAFLLILFLVIGVGAWAESSRASDYYDWSARIDRDEKPAGIFTTTPFPVTEASTEYSITNDEGTKTFTLGIKYYVAKTGTDSGNCQTFSNPCLTIGYAISQTSVGANQAIIVRGGTYLESNLTLKSGTDANNRSMIIGYNQERPIIDGDASADTIIGSHGTTNGHWTFQRLKLQNANSDCMYFGTDNSKKEHDINVIDVETTACPNGLKQGDGSIYMMNVDNVWLDHVAVHRSAGHCIKVGDDADNVIVEWSQAYECGYWSTMVSDLGITDWITDASNAHPTAIDLPQGPEGIEDGQNYIVRYNIAYDSLFYGVQLRNLSNFSFHHNEVYHTAHWDDVPGVSCSENGVSTCPQVLMIDDGNAFLSGNAYSNFVHDSTDAETSGIGVNGLQSGKTINIYNNVISNNHINALSLRGFPEIAGRILNIWNNAIYHDNVSTAAIDAGSNWGTNEVTIQGNIIHQAGNGACVDYDAQIVKSYNLYFYPSGNRGYGNPLETGGQEGDPLWSISPPWTTFATGVGNIQNESDAIDAFPTASAPASTFTTDFADQDRPNGSAWDIGAYEYVSGDTVPPAAPTGLSVQ